MQINVTIFMSFWIPREFKSFKQNKSSCHTIIEPCFRETCKDIYGWEVGKCKLRKSESCEVIPYLWWNVSCVILGW